MPTKKTKKKILVKKKVRKKKATATAATPPAPAGNRSARSTATKKTTRKTTRAAGSPVSRKRDNETIGKIVGLGSAVRRDSLALKDPSVDIPLRTASNTSFNKAKRILEIVGSEAKYEKLVIDVTDGQFTYEFK